MSTPPPFSFWHPASLLATFFGVGKIPFAPGTCGSIASFPLIGLISWSVSNLSIIKNDYDVFHRLLVFLGLMLVCTAIIFLLGIIASHIYVQETGKADPGEVVIDEVAGQMLTFILIIPSLIMTNLSQMTMFFVALAGSFILFRFYDIKKPWPIDWCDSNIHGGLGIMVDDIVAAIMAAVSYYALLIVVFDAMGWMK